MKYPYIKKSKLTRTKIAKAFGYSSVHSFNTSSANKRHMAGLDECLRMNEENNTFDVIKAAIDQIKL
jgi:hypothetical protein